MVAFSVFLMLTKTVARIDDGNKLLGLPPGSLILPSGHILSYQIRSDQRTPAILCAIGLPRRVFVTAAIVRGCAWSVFRSIARKSDSSELQWD